MKRILICAFFVASCSSNKQENTADSQTKADSTSTPTQIKSEITEAVEAIDFPLDSLLRFDSMAALKEAFGDDVVPSVGYMPEGMGTYPNTLLYPKTKNEVEFVWNDTINFKGLSHISVAGENCGWKTKEGITLGTTLKELEKLNKGPFSFYGFGWDYSGLTTWDGGELEKRKIGVCLGSPNNTNEEGLSGDHQIKSSSDLAQRNNPVIRELRLIR